MGERYKAGRMGNQRARFLFQAQFLFQECVARNILTSLFIPR